MWELGEFVGTGGWELIAMDGKNLKSKGLYYFSSLLFYFFFAITTIEK